MFTILLGCPCPKWIEMPGEGGKEVDDDFVYVSVTISTFGSTRSFADAKDTFTSVIEFTIL